MIESFLRIGVSDAIVAGIFSIVVLLITPLIRNPRVTHALWLVVLAKLITPPIVVMPIDLPQSSETLSASDVNGFDEFRFSQEGEEETNSSAPIGVLQNRTRQDVKSTGNGLNSTYVSSGSVTFDWAKLLGGMWILGALMMCILVIARSLRFAQLINRMGEPSKHLAAEIRQLSKSVGLRSPPRAVSCKVPIPPMVIALPRATLLIPDSFVASLEPTQRKALLAHELAHLHRGDHILAWVETAITCIHWWNPVVWIARRGLRKSADKCCDDLVLKWLPGIGRSYAETLLKTLDYLAEDSHKVPLAARGLGEAHTMSERFKSILRGPTSYDVSVREKFFVALFFASVLVISPALSDAEPRRLFSAANLISTAQTDGTPNKTEPPTKSSRQINEVVKQPEADLPTKPAGTWSVSGRVVDRRGTPVHGAEVVLLGQERIVVDAYRPERWFVIRTRGEQLGRPSSTRTDENGEFKLERTDTAANRLAIISSDPLLWTVSVDKPNTEGMEIKLPASGSLVVKCDLPDRPKSVPVYIQLRTFDGINWKTDVLRFHMSEFSLKNPGVTVFEHLPPARFSVEHIAENKTGERAILMTECDRRLTTIESSKLTTIDFNRRVGRPVKGIVRGLEDVELQYARVTIGYWGPEEAPITAGRFKGQFRRYWTNFDAISITSDGQFETAPIPPGEYSLSLFALKKTTANQSRQSSDFRGGLEFTVPASGKLPSLEVVATPVSTDATADEPN